MICQTFRDLKNSRTTCGCISQRTGLRENILESFSFSLSARLYTLPGKTWAIQTETAFVHDSVFQRNELQLSKTLSRTDRMENPSARCFSGQGNERVCEVKRHGSRFPSFCLKKSKLTHFNHCSCVLLASQYLSRDHSRTRELKLHFSPVLPVKVCSLACDSRWIATHFWRR